MKFVAALKSIWGTFAGKVLIVASLGLGSTIGAVVVKTANETDKPKMVINFSNLSREEQEQLKSKRLSEYLTVGDFLRHDDLPGDVHDLGGNQDLIIKKAVVDMLNELSNRIERIDSQARLVFTSGYRSRFRDIEAGGTGSGPHTRGNAVDITFEIPNLSSREAAMRVAGEAYKLGVKSIAIDRNGNSYAVHLDPITPREEGWYTEQQSQQVEENGRKVLKKSYKHVDPETWSSSSQIATTMGKRRRDSGYREAVDYQLIYPVQVQPSGVLYAEPMPLQTPMPTTTIAPAFPVVEPLTVRDSGSCLNRCRAEHDACMKAITSNAEAFMANKYILDRCSDPYLSCWKRCTNAP